MQNSGVFPETACPPASSAFGGLTGVPHIPRPSFSYPSLPALHVILHPTLQDPCIAATVVDSFSGSPGICPVGLSSVPASANHSQQRVLMCPLMCVGLSFWSGLPPVVQGSFTNHSCSLCFLGPNHSMTPDIINTYLLVCLPPPTPPRRGSSKLSQHRLPPCLSIDTCYSVWLLATFPCAAVVFREAPRHVPTLSLRSHSVSTQACCSARGHLDMGSLSFPGSRKWTTPVGFSRGSQVNLWVTKNKRA